MRPLGWVLLSIVIGATVMFLAFTLLDAALRPVAMLIGLAAVVAVYFSARKAFEGPR